MMKRSAVFLLLFMMPSVTFAHPLGFGLMTVKKGENETWTVDLHLSSSIEAMQSIDMVFPTSCRPSTPTIVARDSTRLNHRWTLRCPEKLDGSIGFQRLPSEIQVQLQIQRPSGETRTFLSAQTPTFDLSQHLVSTSLSSSVFTSYLLLGIHHIYTGVDHLLFVLGLVMFMGAETRKLVVAITAFTVGHSVTLSLATLGLISVRSSAAESVIALSLILLAVELTRKNPKASLSYQIPWLVSGGFGLVHGLGFAGVLAEIGIPESKIPTSLFAFNLGVEIFQLFFVGILLLLGWFAQKAFQPSVVRHGRRYLPLLSAYLIGVCGVLWFLERTGFIG